MCRPKHLQVLVGSTWGFLTNVERAIIMPSLWLYLEKQWSADTARQFYGATVAAFCLGILLFTPVVGYASYKGIRTPIILIISNQLEIWGNIMYLIGHSPWVLLFGRFISGVGACCDPPLYTDMIKLTTDKERFSYVIALLLPRQAGLLFGPAFTILVNKLNVDVGTLNINVYNVPGLAMAALWGLHCILIVVAYPDMGRLMTESSTPLTEVPLRTRVQRFFFMPKRKHIPKAEDMREIYSDQEDGTKSSVHEIELVDVDSSSPCCAQNPACIPHLPYMSFTLITLYMTIFMIYFCVLSLEAVLPPVAESLFTWNEVQVSFIYLSAALLILLIFIIYKLLERWMTDRLILTMGMLCLAFAYIWLGTFLAYEPKPDISVGIAIMMTGVGVHVLGVPMVATSCESLYTKLAPQHDMERAQTVFRTVLNVGYFIGPYAGGSLVGLPYAAFILMLALVFVPFVMLCMGYEAFAEPENSDRRLVLSTG